MSPQEMADHVAQVMGDKLGVRGRGLGAKLRRAGRKIPSWVRQEARLLAAGADKSGDPRLRMQLDTTRLKHAHDRCISWLSSVDEKERRKTRLVQWTALVAFRLLLVIVLVILVLVWRGFV